MASGATVVALRPHWYMHVEDVRTCEIITLVGPITYVLQDHHRLVHDAPQPCIVVPPGYYVKVWNTMQVLSTTTATTEETPDAPVYTLLRGAPESTAGWDVLRYSRRKLPLGSCELRFSDVSPFPLLPGESAMDRVALPLLTATEALVVRALAPYTVTDQATGTTIKRTEREEYLIKGPCLYTPRWEELIVRKVAAVCVSPSQLCHFTALGNLIDEDGIARVAGEQWLTSATGLVFAHPATKLEIRESFVVADDEALEFVSSKDFYDEELKVARKALHPYLITSLHTKDGTYMPELHEKLQHRHRQIHLDATEYCVTASCEGPRNTLESREALVVRGPCSFFMQPGERCTPPLKALVLMEEEAVLLEALQTFTETGSIVRTGGSRWLVRGPRLFVPPVYVRVVERRSTIHLHENCGVYVRNVYTGQVRSVFGAPYMLSAEEKLWERPVSAYVRRLLTEPRQSLRVTDMSAKEKAEMVREGGRGSVLLSMGWPTDPREARDGVEEEGESQEIEASVGSYGDEHVNTLDVLKLACANADPPRLAQDLDRYRVVTTNVEHNTIMRLYDTSARCTRIVVGPATVFLGPHEDFTPFSLSGGSPKKPLQIHSLSLYLGPDYMSDIIEAETRDHARLRLKLAYNWEFSPVGEWGEGGATPLAFAVADFIGEACKVLASRVRSAIAAQTFEFFHRHSSTLIRQAIFAASPDRATALHGDSLCFTANGLHITTVDVQSVEPVDVKTRLALTQSVQLAVEIITKAQESDAAHQAALQEQKARGYTDLQEMRDRVAAEQQRVELLQVRGANNALEQVGASRAQALAESAARLVEAQGEVDATPVRCAAHSVSIDVELEILRKRAELDLLHRQALNEVAIHKARALASLEALKYENIMNTLGKSTLMAIASAGPELQVQLLGALGLHDFVVTDGKTPISMLKLGDILSAPQSATVSSP